MSARGRGDIYSSLPSPMDNRRRPGARVRPVATVLHLTDLHLATPDDWAGGDFSKSDIVPLRERPDRLTAFQTTLRALAESPRCPTLDCVVITGDIPFQNGRDTPGWDQLPQA